MPTSWKRRSALAALLLVPLLVVLAAASQLCLRAWLRHGVVLGQCPEGEIRPTVQVRASGLVRGGKGPVTVSLVGHYVSPGTHYPSTVLLPRFEPSLLLVSGGKETALLPVDGWRKQGASKTAVVELPQVSDGDYLVRAKVESSLGESSFDLPLPIYSPARVHVLTDRPLYEPGNTVKFRAVVLKAKDLSPLEGRPGKWVVKDPAGEVVLEELAPTGEWAVVAGHFPLDRGAPSGSWNVQWTSGAASGEASFQVRPFTLPRFRVEAEPGQPFYRRGERPVLKGAVVYSSGAPVANASLSLSWNVVGEWPPPTSWLEKDLPKAAVADRNGRFRLELPEVPGDLLGQATLLLHLGASDAAGDRVEGRASILLAEDPIQVAAVTELGDGLVEGFNNRLYLRASTADGRVLAGVQLTVQRSWEPKDPGVNGRADEDGVAALQIDPGTPVNVVIPPQPFRPPPKERVVVWGGARDLFRVTDEGAEDQESAEPSLADQVAMEKWDGILEPCARWVEDGGGSLQAALRVSQSGAAMAVAAPSTRLGRCVAEALKRRSLPPGRERLYHLSFTFRDADLPKLGVSIDGFPELSGPIISALADAVAGLRDCIPRETPTASLPLLLEWRSRAKSKELEIGWVPTKGEAFPAAALSCMRSRLNRLTLEDPGQTDALGLGRLHVTAPAKYQASRPQAVTMLGHEFLVTAREGDKVLGSTKLRMSPGKVPPVRLRASPILANPGEVVEVEILRGPEFQGELPEKVVLVHRRAALEAKVDKQERKARFQLPADAEGWAEVSWSGARAVVYVKPRAQLSLSVRPEQERYAPGELARLTVETELDGKGGPAAVGLFGVDESLSQLASLPGPDALEGLRPPVGATPAFAGLDAQALSMGRVRGANAAAATILKVNALPPAEEVEKSIHAGGGGSFDPLVDLTDHFYSALAELHLQARAWEASAPAGEKMLPSTMARLWEKALTACEKRKQSVTDAFDRRLRLSMLPQDLLALTDPRLVLVSGTRLPEDVENWSNWVAREMP